MADSALARRRWRSISPGAGSIDLRKRAYFGRRGSPVQIGRIGHRDDEQIGSHARKGNDWVEKYRHWVITEYGKARNITLAATKEGTRPAFGRLAEDANVQ